MAGGQVFPDLPALALPVAGKSDFVWPSEQAEFLGGLRTRVRRVLTVGWRAAEPHFVEKLHPMVMSGHRAMLVTGGPSGDQDVKDIVTRFGSLGERLNYRATTAGFSSIFADPNLEWLLEPASWPRP